MIRSLSHAKQSKALLLKDRNRNCFCLTVISVLPLQEFHYGVFKFCGSIKALGNSVLANSFQDMIAFSWNEEGSHDAVLDKCEPDLLAFSKGRMCQSIKISSQYRDNIKIYAHEHTFNLP